MGESVEGPVILKPRNDERLYRYMTLDNGMKVLLISDKDTDKAAAAMDVNVGFFSDPEDLPGLAHFLEHMLFYSSEKYPTEDSYSKFLTEHGGHSNAYTSAERTNFHFDVSHEHLEEALDRFAQFFICPLLSQDATDREMKAVDSEHSKNLTSDPWRINQLHRHLSKKEHPYHKFGTGSLATLAKDKTRDALLQFYEEHYSANIMCLVVYGRESLDALSKLVVAKFSAVVNKQREAPIYPGDPWGSEGTKVLVRAVPVTDGHSLDLLWCVPSDLEDYKAGASNYVGHLTGHEGTGSLFSLLKKKGWASSLCSGVSESSKEYAFFTLTIELTDEGHGHVEDVLAFVTRYLAIVAEEGIQEWKFEEVRCVAESRFHFQDKRPPLSYATTIASNLQLYPPEDVLAATSLPREFNPKAIQRIVDALVLPKVRVMWLSKSFEGQGKETEPWYQTSFSREPITDEQLAAWASLSSSSALAEDGRQLVLPPANPFIASDFSLKDPDSSSPPHPRLVRKSPKDRLWFKPDLRFRTPKAIVVLDIALPDVYTSPEHALLLRIFTRMLVDELNDYVYFAEVAGLGYKVEHKMHGVQVYVQGYNHKLLNLLEKIVSKLTSFTVRPDRFLIVKEKEAKDLANMRYQQPYMQAFKAASLLLDQKGWHPSEYVDVLPGLGAGDLEKLIPHVLSRVFLEAYVTGNYKEEEASAACDLLLSSLPNAKVLLPSQHPERRVVHIQEGSEWLYKVEASNPDDENSALLVYFQTGVDNPRMNMLTQLLVQAAKRETYQQLRSVEQLGYIVFLLPRNDYGVQGFQFLIQSNTKDPGYVEARVNAFLEDFETKLDEMSEEDFKTHVEALAAQKLEKFKNLYEEAAFFWKEIEFGTLEFGREEREVATLRELKKEDLVLFFKEAVMAAGPKRRKLTVQVWSSKHAAAKPIVADTEGAEAAANGKLDGPSPKLENEDSVLENGESEAAKKSDHAAVGKGERKIEQIVSIEAFRRSQTLFPSLRSGSHSACAA